MPNQQPPVEMSNLDSSQVLKYAFDETTGRLRVDAQVTANISGEQEVIISHIDDSIKIGDGTDLLSVNADGSINVKVTENVALTDDELRATPVPVSGTVSVSNFPATQPISTASLPLPTGAATQITLAALLAMFISDDADMTQVSASASSVLLLAANASRKGFVLHNASTSICYVALGLTATTSAYWIKLGANGTYESLLPIYQGNISAIWDTADGSMKITELI